MPFSSQHAAFISTSRDSGDSCALGSIWRHRPPKEARVLGKDLAPENKLLFRIGCYHNPSCLFLNTMQKMPFPAPSCSFLSPFLSLGELGVLGVLGTCPIAWCLVSFSRFCQAGRMGMKREKRVFLPFPPSCLPVSSTHQHLLWAGPWLGWAWGTELPVRNEQLHKLVRGLKRQSRRPP